MELYALYAELDGAGVDGEYDRALLYPDEESAAEVDEEEVLGVYMALLSLGLGAGREGVNAVCVRYDIQLVACCCIITNKRLSDPGMMVESSTSSLTTANH